MKSYLALKNKTFIFIFLITLFGCKSNKHHCQILKNGNSNWDVIYSSNKYLIDYIYGYCFLNDSNYYAYHYYGEGKTPFDYGSYDRDIIDTTVSGNLFYWRIDKDTLFLSNEAYFIAKIDQDTMVLLTGVPENPMLILAKSK